MGKSILLSLFIVCSFFAPAQFNAGNLAAFRAEEATANNTNFSIVELNSSMAYLLSPANTVVQPIIITKILLK
jgi:hypothetical protein